MTKLESPYRSPLIVVEAMKDIIKDKIVCDLGCACGDILLEMKKYAKEVVGMEKDGDRVATARTLGLNVVQGDVQQDELPIADVYYLWIVKYLVKRIVDRIPKGVIIVGADVGWQEEDVFIGNLGFEGKWIEVPYNEGEDWRQRGMFKLFVIEKR